MATTTATPKTNSTTKKWKVSRTDSSSFIAWIGWSTDVKAPWLIISLKNGKRYIYPGVTPQRGAAMSRAKSVGQYYHRYIKGQFSALRLHVDPPSRRK